MIAAVYFYTTRSNWLPRRQADKKFRWDYDYIERGDAPDDEIRRAHEYGLTDLSEHGALDEWTIGSSSSISSGSVSPVDGDSMWEGETLASDGEKDVEMGMR